MVFCYATIKTYHVSVTLPFILNCILYHYLLGFVFLAIWLWCALTQFFFNFFMLIFYWTSLKLFSYLFTLLLICQLHICLGYLILPQTHLGSVHFVSPFFFSCNEFWIVYITVYSSWLISSTVSYLDVIYASLLYVLVSSLCSFFPLNSWTYVVHL